MTELIRYGIDSGSPRTGHFIDWLGDEVYTVERVYHREDGPAVSNTRGTQLWYYHGNRHRTDGPAVIYADGFCEWFLDGKFYDFEEYVIRAGWTEDQIVEWKLTHATSS